MTACAVMLAFFLTFANSTYAQGATDEGSMSTATTSYRDVLDRELGCPIAVFRGGGDYQFCVRVIPPGHREGEKELLVVVVVRNGEKSLIIRAPEVALSKRLKNADQASSDGAMIQSIEIHDPAIIDGIVSDRDLSDLRLDLWQKTDWYIDATRYEASMCTLVGRTVVEVQGPGIDKEQPTKLLTWLEHIRSEAKILLGKGR